MKLHIIIKSHTISLQLWDVFEILQQLICNKQQIYILFSILWTIYDIVIKVNNL